MSQKSPSGLELAALKVLNLEEEVDNNQQVDDVKKVCTTTEVRVDHENQRYPYCIVWTPLPFVSYILPFIGHVGICTSEGVIHDFGGSGYVAVDSMTFGKPYKYIKMV